MSVLHIWSTITLLICGLLCDGIRGQDTTADPVFKYDPEQVETGVVYQYLKSNIDGSRSGHVSLYVAEKNQLESLKWHEGGTEATLVKATMDWERFSIGHFETWRLIAGDQPQQRAMLDYDPARDVVVVSVGDQKMDVKIDHWPWHSYDFDFASLNFLFRHLVKPEIPFQIGITDLIRDDQGQKFGDKGPVTVTYQQSVQRHGHDCREYTIDGRGLEDRGGHIWIRKSDGVLMDYEIDLPDEPGFRNGKLQLQGIDRMTPAQWEDYKKSRISTGR